jgi:hypothetical protein
MNGLDLSKSQKRIARELIEAGLLKEYENGIVKIDKTISAWKEGRLGIKETYYKVFENLGKFDKHLGQRYDGMTGSNYLFIIAGQLIDGLISLESLDHFDQDVKDKILLIYGLKDR